MGQTKTVAVFDFSNNGLSQNEVRTLTDRLRTELVQTGKCNVVERSKIDDILKEQKFQLSGCVDECLIEVGKMLGATSVVIGSIGKVGNTFTISARIVDAETGEVETAFSYDSMYDIETLLTRGMQEIALKLVGNEFELKEIQKEEIRNATMGAVGELAGASIVLVGAFGCFYILLVYIFGTADPI